MKWEHFLTPHTKTQNGLILKRKAKNYKILRGKHRTLWHKLQILFNSSLRLMKIKTKINKWNLIKLKSFCIAKGTHTGWKDNLQNGTKCLKKYNSQGVCVCACAHAHVHFAAQSCLTLCDPLDCSPPGSSIHGILQARILEWVATSSSRGSSQPRDQTHVSCVSSTGRWMLYHWATWEDCIYIYGLHIPLRFKLSIWFMNMLLAENIIDAWRGWMTVGRGRTGCFNLGARKKVARYCSVFHIFSANS